MPPTFSDMGKGVGVIWAQSGKQNPGEYCSVGTSLHTPGEGLGRKVRSRELYGDRGLSLTSPP